MKKYVCSERSDLFEPDAFISIAAKIRGNLSADDIAWAVSLAYRANEATMSKIMLEADGAAYYVTMPDTGCGIYTDSRDMLTIIRESEKRVFGLNRGELVRTYIIPEESGIFRLLIHAHHLAGDGKAVLILLRDILTALDGRSPEYKPMKLIGREYLEKRATLPLRAKLFARYINRKWKREEKISVWDDYYEIHRKYWSGRSTDISVKYISVSELNKRRPEGTTLNSLLVADILKEHPAAHSVGIPVSIRGNDEFDMSNRTSGIQIKYAYNNRKSHESNVSMIHREIYKLLGDDNAKYFVLLFMAEISPTLTDAALLQAHGCFDSRSSRLAAEIFGYTGKNKRDIGVSNLGRVEFHAERTAITELLFIPPKISYADEIYGAVTLGDTLTLCRHDIISS